MSVVQEKVTECAACGKTLTQQRHGKYKDFCSIPCRNLGRGFCRACGNPLVQPHNIKIDFCSDRCTAIYTRTGAGISPSYFEERYRTTCKGCGNPIIQPKCGGKQFCTTLCCNRYYRQGKRQVNVSEDWGSYGPETRKMLQELQALNLSGTAKRMATAIDREYVRRKKNDPNKVRGAYASYLCKTCGREFRRRPRGHASREYCSGKCQPSRHVSRKSPPNAVFTWDEVDEMRKLHATGLLTYSQMAEKYGVHPKTIARVINYETYKIEDDPRHKPKQETTKIMRDNYQRLIKEQEAQ